MDDLPFYGRTSDATADTNLAPTSRTLSAQIMGVSTGTAIIGGYGVGVDPTDLTSSDKLFDLTNTQQVPPNNVTFTVSGVVIGEDRLLVGPKASDANFEYDQFALESGLSGAAETSAVTTASIWSDTPTTGTVRIQLDNGVIRRVAFTSWAACTFTIGSTDFSASPAASGNNVMVSYIDKLAASTSEPVTVVYATDRDWYVRVRCGTASPIKTFETPATLTTAGGTATAIRTSDA